MSETTADRLRADLTGRDRSAVLVQLAVLSFILLPHLTRLPIWIGLTSGGAMGLFALAVVRRARVLKRDDLLLKVARAGVAVVAMLVVYVNHVGQLGRDAGVEFLAVLTALKHFELRHGRDQSLLVALGIVLIAANFFYDNSPLAALWALGSVLGLVACLALNEASRSGSWDRRRTLVGPLTGLVAYAIPVALVAFVVFPRIPGPLWGNALEHGGARSGLAEELAMGAFSSLIASSEVAFHVEFDGELPPPRQRYWRARVLGMSDGITWRPLPYAIFDVPEPEALGEPIRYTVQLKAHQQRYVPALDVPVAWPEGLYRRRELTLGAEKPVTKDRRFTLSSATALSYPALHRYQETAYLALPDEVHPRARALAASWRDRTPEDRVSAALDLFADQPFRYTLEPPILTRDPVDEFLFETRAGFCEHYASAFVTLMRAAGVPARIVTGYQGGEYNDLGDHLVVRQRDAHAWAEVFLADRGWVRVDPTAVIAPDRVDRGIDAFRSGMLGLGLDSPVGRFAGRLSLTLDYLRMEWTRWVVGFDDNRQKELFQRLSLDWLQGIGAKVAALIAAVGLIGLVHTLFVLRERPPATRAGRLWRRFEKRCARAGLARQSSESAAAFGRRAKAAFPSEARTIAAVVAAHDGLRYGRPIAGSEARQVKALTEAVRAFRPRRLGGDAKAEPRAKPAPQPEPTGVL